MNVTIGSGLCLEEVFERASWVSLPCATTVSVRFWAENPEEVIQYTCAFWVLLPCAMNTCLLGLVPCAMNPRLLGLVPCAADV